MRDVIIVLPDLHSTHNVGSFFRTADGAGVRQIVLAGFTATPDKHPGIAKVSLGAEESVPWQHVDDVVEYLQTMKQQGYMVIAVEQTDASIDYDTAHYAQNIVLVFGNERTGVAPEVLRIADMVVHIPMRGVKESLNVSIAGGVILYHVCHE